MDLFKAEIWRSFTKLMFLTSSLVVITSAFSCNFDTSMCGFVQDRNDDFDWTRQHGSTPSTATGPSADHTTGTWNGYYMYIETSYPREPGDYAKLISPKLQFGGSTSLQFYYHMYGAGMGTLTVNINGNTVFNASGDKGNKWWKAAVDVNLSGKYAVTFQATTGSSYQSDIAIDDFALESMCADPGTPLHGSRTVNSKDGGFSEGAIVSFQCNTNYKLSGAKKIVCSKGKWSEEKFPQCILQGCILPAPTFAHAHVMSNPVLNTKGSYVEYACDVGYRSFDHRPTRLLCDKDPKTPGYKWNGTFTCEKITCSRPPLPSTGHGNITTRPSGSTIEASYSCNPGYVMRDSRGQILETFVIKCDDTSGSWSKSSLPTCVKTCYPLDGSLDHGSIKSRSTQHTSEDGRYIYPEGTIVTFGCDNLYKLQENTGERKCLKSGSWSGSSLHCVRSACSDPGRVLNGHAASNSTDTSSFPIWTVVTFTCNVGYKLVGLSRERQCRTDGTWSGFENPRCEPSTVTCKKPEPPDHGRYEPEDKTLFKLNEVIAAFCDSSYYLWGKKTKKCCGLDNGGSAWLPATLRCSDFIIADSKSWDSNWVTECLLPAKYDEECKKLGKHGVILNDKMSCEATSEDEATTSSAKHDSELDKMTIVVATAGSTLGALIVLLTALVCFRRFHRGRRFRRYSFRSRRYSDDDRIAIIAAYSGDVHFILPSYDEAISQVERSPPPFESVVEGAQGSDNEPPPNSSNASTSQAANLEAVSAPENGNSSEPVGDSTSIREHDTITQLQPIHIVNNPLADTASDTRSHAPNDTVQTADAVNETGGTCNLALNSSDESIDTGDAELWPSRPPDSLPSSSSEDDLTSSQTQPLLGSGSRGVMV